MSTTINVTVGGNGLLEQSHQQMQANRFGRLEKDTDAKDLEGAEALRLSLVSASPDAGLKAKRVRPQPAARRFGTAALQVGHLWSFETRNLQRRTIQQVTALSGAYYPSEKRSISVTDGPAWERLIVSGDGTQSATIECVSVVEPAPSDYFGGIEGGDLGLYWAKRAVHSRPTHINESTEYWFPSGAGTMIYVAASNAAVSGWRAIVNHQGIFNGAFITADSYSEATVTTTEGSLVSATTYAISDRKIQVFSCGNNHVREIDCPNLLEQFINYVFPPYEKKTREKQWGLLPSDVFEEEYFASGQMPGDPPSYPTETQNWLEWGWGWTPGFFDYMNQVAPFPAGFVIKSSPASILRVSEDYSQGGWVGYDGSVSRPYFSPVYNGGLPLFYATRKQDSEVKTSAKKASLKPAVNRVPIPTYSASVSSEALLATLDWNDPAYCYDACRAMGFSDADLQP